MPKFSACQVPVVHCEPEGANFWPVWAQAPPCAGVHAWLVGYCLARMLPALSANSDWKYDTVESYSLRMFMVASVVFDRRIYFMKAGIATAARMPMMATTIMSSIRVKPRT